MFRNILVPLDTSELAECALTSAMDMAKAFDAKITLLTVVDPILFAPRVPIISAIGPIQSMPQAGPRSLPDQEEVDTYMGRLDKYLEVAQNRVRAYGVDVTAKVVNGDPATEICDAANDGDVDLIVMSTHGFSGIKRWMLGSVADRVLHCAQVPVMLIRACSPD